MFNDESQRQVLNVFARLAARIEQTMQSLAYFQGAQYHGSGRDSKKKPAGDASQKIVKVVTEVTDGDQPQRVADPDRKYHPEQTRVLRNRRKELERLRILRGQQGMGRTNMLRFGYTESFVSNTPLDVPSRPIYCAQKKGPVSP